MIALNKVCAGYGESEILHSVTAEIRDGEVCALIGPNGCGKSTLVKALTGIIPVTHGDISYDGIPQKDLSGTDLAKLVSYLPQSRNTPDITVERMVLHGRFPYLSYPRRYRKEDLEAVDKALSRVGAEELKDELVGNLSGGQRQKVYVAMALAQDTKTVLMDEPTTYLDIKNQIELMELNRRLAREGKAILIVLHDLDMVLRYADRAILLNEGSIIHTGTPLEIFDSGDIEKVFNVVPHIVEGEDGIHCYCTPDV